MAGTATGQSSYSSTGGTTYFDLTKATGDRAEINDAGTGINILNPNGTINDNGRGFHPEASHGGFGLDSMRERGALIGATLTVSSQPQDGSRVELRLPLVHGAVSHGG